MFLVIVATCTHEFYSTNMHYASVTQVDIARKARVTVYPYLELLFPLQSVNKSAVAISSLKTEIRYRT